MPLEPLGEERRAKLLAQRQELTDALEEESPYDLVGYLARARVYSELRYPDLAAGDAYRALLLCDEIKSDQFEFHMEAFDAWVGRLRSPEATWAVLMGLDAEEMAGHAGWAEEVRLAMGDELDLADETDEEDLEPAEAARRAAAKQEEADRKTAEFMDAISRATYWEMKELERKDEEESLTPEDRRALSILPVAALRAFQSLSASLLEIGCLRSAAEFVHRGLETFASDLPLLRIKEGIEKAAAARGYADVDIEMDSDDLPDSGRVRREAYPWNTYEPDRFDPDSLAELNEGLKAVAPKCAVQVSELPVLADGQATTETCRQLGVFATADIAPGERVLEEYSVLTASNRHKAVVCDACSGDLPALGAGAGAGSGSGGRLGDSDDENSDEDSDKNRQDDSEVDMAADDGAEAGLRQCHDCYDAVFCSQRCYDVAMERYHPAVCDLDVDSMAKDPSALEADQTLHLLLLARVLALASHGEVHPLEVPEIKYIWGDFEPCGSNETVAPEDYADKWTLPFSFKYNLETPLHILEAMEIDPYATLAEHDFWVLNTIYAKTRGTASARKNPRDGRPDVAAVHPFWCLANHDCDPNVTWECGGDIVLRARETRVSGRPAGVKKGEEILNHYCDVDLPVYERREWAKGSLGGWCMCARCRKESGEVNVE